MCTACSHLYFYNWCKYHYKINHTVLYSTVHCAHSSALLKKQRQTFSNEQLIKQIHWIVYLKYLCKCLYSTTMWNKSVGFGKSIILLIIVILPDRKKKLIIPTSLPFTIKGKQTKHVIRYKCSFKFKVSREVRLFFG